MHEGKTNENGVKIEEKMGARDEREENIEENRLERKMIKERYGQITGE